MFARCLVSAARAACLEERARQMRFSPTASEQILWRHLSGSKLGYGFRRQLVIGNHIVDFACTKLRLVVEIDGASHEGRERKDAQRDRKLAALGWRTLRVEDALVRFDVVVVVARIKAACALTSAT